MCFDSENALLNTEEIYRHQTPYVSVPYQSLYGETISKLYNHSFQNGCYKTKIFS